LHGARLVYEQIHQPHAGDHTLFLDWSALGFRADLDTYRQEGQ